MKKWLAMVAGRFSIVSELIHFLWHQKLWWMIPMVVVLLVIGMVLVLGQHAAFAPFIYTLF